MTLDHCIDVYIKTFLLYNHIDMKVKRHKVIKTGINILLQMSYSLVPALTVT